MNTEKAILSWSGGKESALALYELQKRKTYEISTLLTTLTKEYERTSMHGVRETLLERQADSLGIPLEKVFISKGGSNEEYESKIADVLKRYLSKGISSVVFGDIFLEGVREYREEKLAGIGMNAVFPLWKKNTARLARKFIDSGFKSIVTCVDSRALDKDFAGRAFDEEFISGLPSGVDPCGENGEFHSFVYDGPIFHDKILFKKGRVVLRDSRFYYCDLIPLDTSCRICYHMPVL